MRRALLFLAALACPSTAWAQHDEASVRALAEQLFGPVPADAATVLHPLPWAARPPVPGTTHVLVAQDSRTALIALIAIPETRGQPPAPQALLLGQAGDPAQCQVPPGMVESEVLEEFNAPREGDAGLGQPIVTMLAADGTALIGLTWRLGERGNAAHGLALFRQDGALLQEIGCFVVRLDATITYEGGAEDAPARRRRVSNVWRVEPGPDPATPLLLRDTSRPQRPLAIRPDPDLGRYAIVPPAPVPEREDRRRRR